MSTPEETRHKTIEKAKKRRERQLVTLRAHLQRRQAKIEGEYRFAVMAADKALQEALGL